MIEARRLLTFVFALSLVTIYVTPFTSTTEAATQSDLPDDWQKVPEGEQANETSNVTLDPVSDYGNLTPNQTTEQLNISDLTKAELSDFLNTSAPLDPALPTEDRTPLNLSNLENDLPLPSDHIVVGNNSTLSLPNVVNETVNETLAFNSSSIPANLSSDPTGLVNSAVDPVYGLLDDVVFTIVWETKYGRGAGEGVALGLPELIDFNNDGLTDVSVTVSSCLSQCVKVDIDHVAGGERTPAMVMIGYDTDGDRDNPTTKAVWGGYDTFHTYGHQTKKVDNPADFGATLKWGSSTCSWSYDLTLTSSGVNTPFTVVGEYVESRNGQVREYQNATATWMNRVPSPISTTLTQYNCYDTRKTEIDYSADSSARVYFDYRKAALKDGTWVGDNLDFYANQLPSSWSLKSNWYNGGTDESHSYTASTVVDYARLERNSWKTTDLSAGASVDHVEGLEVRNVPTSVSFTRSPCRMSFSASAPMGITYYSGTDHFAGIGKDNFYYSRTDSGHKHTSFSVPNIKSFEATSPCYSGQGYSEYTYQLGGELSEFYLRVEEGNDLLITDIRRAHNNGLPASATVRIAKDRFQVKQTSEPFGRAWFCNTQDGGCPYLSSNDHVAIAGNGGTAGRVTGVRTLDVGVINGAFRALATLSPGGQWFDFQYSWNGNNVRGFVSNLPTDLAFRADPAANIEFDTGSPISEIQAWGSVGGYGFFGEARSIPSGTSASLGYSSDTVSLTSNTHIGRVRGCFTPHEGCQTPSYNGVYADLGDYYAANFPGVKSFSVDFSNDQLDATLTTNGGFNAKFFLNSRMDVQGVVCGVPSSVSLSLDPNGEAKGISYSGSSRTGCVKGVAVTPHELRIYANIQDIPSSVSATVDTGSLDTKAVLSASGKIGSADVRARYGSGNFEGVAVCADGVDDVTLDWNSDISDVSLTTPDRSIDRVRFAVSQDYAVGCPGVVNYDYLTYSGDTGDAVGQVSGLDSASYSASTSSYTGTVKTTTSPPTYFVYVKDNAYVGAAVIGRPSSVKVTTDLRDKIDWSASSSTKRLYLAVKTPDWGAAQVNLYSVPKDVTVTYDALNRNAKVNIPSGDIGSATIRFDPHNDVYVYLYAAAIPTTTVTWSSDFQAGSLNVDGQIGYLEFGLVLDGGFALPSDTGVFLYDGQYSKYISGKFKCVRGGSWEARGGIDISATTCGGSNTYFDVYAKQDGDWMWGYLKNFPEGTYRIASDKTSWATLTTPGPVGKLYLTGTYGNNFFYVLVRGLDDTDVAWETSNNKLDVNLDSSLTDLEVYASNTGGILGSSVEQFWVDAQGIPNDVDVKLDQSNGKYRFASANPVDRIRFQITEDYGCRFDADGDFLWWNIDSYYCDGDSYAGDIHGVEEVSYKKGSAHVAEVRTSGSNGLLGQFTRENYYDPVVRTWVDISNVPSSVRVEVDPDKSNGHLDYDASSSVNKVVVHTEEMVVGDWYDYIRAEIYNLPTKVDASWKIDNPGHINFDANGRVSGYACARIWESWRHNVCASGSLRELFANWDVAAGGGHVAIDTNWEIVNGGLDYRMGDPSNPYAAAYTYGAWASQNFKFQWWDLWVSGDYWFDDYSGVCVKIPDWGWWCYP